jgi:hypothetical protein
MAKDFRSDSPDNKDALRRVLKSQYRAAVGMLREAIERCPDDLWTATTYPNPFWRVAYHALYYTHLYLHPSDADFKARRKAGEEYRYMAGLPSPSQRRKNAEPFSKADVLEYATFCLAVIGPAVDCLDLDAPKSGFWWYRMSKLEHQIVNIRHAQHHAAQLIDRLATAGGAAFKWASAGPVD